MKFILIESIYIFGQIFTILILIRSLLSWIPMASNTVIYKIVYNLTEPIFKPIRKILFRSPLGNAGINIDISPLISFILIQIISNIIIKIITII